MIQKVYINGLMIILIFFLDDTEYYLSLNPICNELNEDIDVFPMKLQQFINNSGACDYDCDTDAVYANLCAPRLMGNGRCDEACNVKVCKYDNGDCMQLCFAPEIANCSMDKLMNSKCDPGCNNHYCSGYEWGSNMIRSMASKSDLWNCDDVITNISGIMMNHTCHESAKQSIYIDGNVPDDPYNYCDIVWIGDGECDDTCRTNECMNDNGDCDLGCVGDTCNTMYEAWIALVGATIYKVDHDNFCTNIWPIIVAFFGDDNGGDCNVILENADYNNDKSVNFREFVVVSYAYAGGDRPKGTQINCSHCIGTEYYNI
eukprot:140859_1